MQFTLDALPHRSQHADWRVLINQGVWGCKPRTEIGDREIRFIAHCNQNRYDADGLALGEGYPSLSIPPYVIQANKLILGRLPASLRKPEALPALPHPRPLHPEQLVRAARWGDISQISKLLDAGTDINAASEGGSTALLIAVQMHGADTNDYLSNILGVATHHIADVGLPLTADRYLFADSEMPGIYPPFPRDTATSTAYPSVMRSYEQYDATKSRSASCSSPHRPLACKALPYA